LNTPVSVTRYHRDSTSASIVPGLCQGLQKTPIQTRILVKPNLVLWDDDFRFPPSLGDLVEMLRANEVKLDIEGYHRYRNHLMRKYELKPQFDPKHFGR